MYLDKPITTQYIMWIKGFLKGDLGNSLITKRPVKVDIGEFFPATFEIVIVAALVMAVGGIALGIVSAKYANSWLDGIIRVGSYLGIVAPAFVWAIIFMLVFGYVLKVLPTTGRLSAGVIPPSSVTGMYTIDALLKGKFRVAWDALKHLLLPAVALALGGLAQAARITRSSMTENMDRDYVLAERAYGVLDREILWKYLLKPSLIPTVSVLALDIAALFGNAFLVEQIFNYPGLSRYGMQAMLNKDLNAISAVIMILGIVFISLNILIDFVIARLDPRIGLLGRQ